MSNLPADDGPMHHAEPPMVDVAIPGGGDLWIFGYGSLMWEPGFRHIEMRTGRVRGYHRRLCLYSVRYRGTRECPGVVLGLDRGGSCVGRAFRVAANNAAATIAYLHDREMSNRAYAPRFLETTLEDGEEIKAYAFVIRRDHPQYAGRLTPEETAQLIRHGCGERGTGLEYLANTVRHLEELGIPDRALHEVLGLVMNDQPHLE